MVAHAKGTARQSLTMKTSHRLALAAAGIALAGAAITVALAMAAPNTPAKQAAAQAAGQPSLTVAIARLQPATLPIRVSANGNIMAWQEASIGTEANGLRLTEVKVNVGDKVRRGQPLATFASEPVEAELAQSQAAVAEADVALAEAAANAERARMLQETGALSAQQIQQYLNAERTARARLDAARAVERTQRLRLVQTRIAAPDDGVISARAASVGAVVPAGQELFRLIRGGRLEWRAEVAAPDLLKLKPGQRVRITPTGGDVIEGRLRMLAPVIDIQTRNGLVYVDLPASDTARAGMFARGDFEIGASEVMTLPQSAVQLREGFSYVMRVGPDSRVIQTKVTPGRRAGHRVEIVGGLDAQDRVVISGAAFLGDGDLVRVIDAPEAAPPAPSPSAAPRLTRPGSEGAR
jgi:RND family efflux transporter MFP subunit